MARRISIEIFIVLAIGLVLGLFGPFGTFEMQTPLRIAFWLAFTLAGYAIFRPMILVGTWVSEALGVPRIVGVGLGQVLAAVPLTFLIALLFARFDVRRVLSADGIGGLYFQVWLIGFLINGLFVLVLPASSAPPPPSRGLQATPAPAQEPAPAVPPVAPPVTAFAERLPAGFGPVLALKGEDHYVRAIGADRSDLILIRLRDAIGELGDLPGLQVHRSWWVAETAIAGIERDGRSATIILSNGTRVPVARDRLSMVRALKVS